MHIDYFWLVNLWLLSFFGCNDVIFKMDCPHSRSLEQPLKAE